MLRRVDLLSRCTINMVIGVVFVAQCAVGKPSRGSKNKVVQSGQERVHLKACDVSSPLRYLIMDSNHGIG